MWGDPAPQPVSFGMHHIFFPPGFDPPVSQTVPEGDGGDALHDSLVNELLPQQCQLPVLMASGRFGAGQRYEASFGFVSQFSCGSRPRGIIESGVKTASRVALPHPLDGAYRNAHLLGNVGIGAAAVAGQQHLDSLDDPSVVLTLRHDILDLMLLLGRELDGMFTHVCFVYSLTKTAYHRAPCPTELRSWSSSVCVIRPNSTYSLTAAQVAKQ